MQKRDRMKALMLSGGRDGGRMGGMRITKCLDTRRKGRRGKQKIMLLVSE